MEYLAIKNWRKYQSLRTKGPWIKDYPSQIDDPVMGGLSMFCRGVLQELRRVRGRTGKNILYDLAYIARATHAISTDIPPLKHALSTLLARGLLVLTNQEFEVLETPEIEKEKEIEIEKEKKQHVPVPQESKFDEAWKLYPKRTKPYEAERQWCDAVNREASKQVRSYEEIEAKILEKTAIFGEIMRGKLARGEIGLDFIPKMADWLYGGCFLEEPSTWEALNGGKRSANGNVPSKLQESLRVIDNIEFGDQADVPRNASTVSAPKIRA